MRCLFSFLPVAFFTVAVCGCQRSTASTAEVGGQSLVPRSAAAAGDGGQKTPGKDLPAPKGGIVRRMEVAEVQNLLRQLGLAYRSFELINMRGPRNLDEFAPEFGKQAKMLEALKSGTWVFIYNVNRQQLTAAAILAYEAQGDQTGNRLVLLGDGSVHLLDEATFNKTPKAR